MSAPFYERRRSEKGSASAPRRRLLSHVWRRPKALTRGLSAMEEAFRHELRQTQWRRRPLSRRRAARRAALVFINALGSDLRIWDEVARILRRDFRLIRYDKRGHGLSESGPDRYDIADYARDLGALLDKLAVDRATIVGLSVGGLVAQELYRQRPHAFAALVLCDTAAKIGTDESWDARIAEIEKGGVEAIADAILLRWFTADFRARRSDELTGWRTMLTRTPKQGYLAACGAPKRADLRPYAGAIEVRTLCLVGDEDGSTPVGLVQETAGLIKGSRFEVIRGAGHLPNLKQPETLARLITQHAEGTTLG